MGANASPLHQTSIIDIICKPKSKSLNTIYIVQFDLIIMMAVLFSFENYFLKGPLLNSERKCFVVCHTSSFGLRIQYENITNFFYI